MKQLLALSLLLSPMPDASSPMVPVMIDAKTEQALGKFPFDRKYYAQMLDVLHGYQVKGVVFKFFLIALKEPSSDSQLSTAMKRVPVLLQAAMQDEPNPNPLDKRWLMLENLPLKNVIQGNNRGWIPLPQFAQHAQDVGFIDIHEKAPQQLPLVEKFNNHYVKSLTMATLQFMYPDLKISWGTAITRGQRSIPMNASGEITAPLPKADDLQYLSFVDVLRRKIPEQQLANKLIYLGYDGEMQNKVVTPIGELKSQRYYYYALDGILKELATK